MDFVLLLKGIFLGLAIAVPVGPVGVLCIRKTIQYGRLSGLCSGLGAAAADMIYAIIAAFGLTYVSEQLLQRQFWIYLGGGGFLIYLGLKIFLSKPIAPSLIAPQRKTLLADFFSTFFLTLTNPAAIFSFLAVFAGLKLSCPSGSIASSAYLIFGILAGSTLWWLMLSGGMTLFKNKLTLTAVQRINRFAGIAILSFGLAAWTKLCW